MKKLLVIALTLAAGIAAFAQNVSSPLVQAMESGQYYLKLSTTGPFSMTVEVAAKGGVQMSRTKIGGQDNVTLSTGGNTFILDEKAKTWRPMPGALALPSPGQLRFVREGRGRIDGNDYSYDEYSTNGTSLKFYYKNNKIEAIDFGDPQMGPMKVQAYGSEVPGNMYFCVGADWKGSGTAPPKCSVSAPGNAGTQTVPQNIGDKLAVTEEGVRRAFEQLQLEEKGKTGDQIAHDIMKFNAEVNEMMLFGVVTGELIEMAIARCKVYPHPSLLTTTGNMLLEAKEPKTALEYFENASKLQPDFEAPLYGQIECLLDMGQIEKARTVVPKVIEVTSRKPVLDGKAWLYKAMLGAQKDPIDAAGALFKSLSLGYFSENTVSLICSLLTELDKAEMNASVDEQDFMSLINKVFTPDNLDNIRKGITYGDDDFFPADEASFNATPAGNLEGNRTNNARIASGYQKRSSQHLDKANAAAQKGPALSLLTAMEAVYLPDNMTRLIESAKERPETQKALESNAKARKEIAKIEVPEKMRAGLEASYERLTKALSVEYGVDGFYLPDARAYWCLRLLERYHKYCLDYVQGVFGHFDEETRTFHGYLPEGFKTNILNHVHRSHKDSTMTEAMNKKQEAAALKLFKECLAEWEKWVDEHPNASNSAEERARRRIFRPYRIMTEVTHPLEHLDQVDVVSETEKTNSYVVYFNSTVKPVLEAWWRDISKYCSYCCDGPVSTYFWYKNLAHIYTEYGSTFEAKAVTGDALYQARQQILKRLAEIKEEQWQDHIEAIAEHEQEEKDARDIAELKGRQWYGLSDLFISMQTPLGSIDFGLKEGKFGIHLDVKDSYIHPEPLDARKVNASILTNENVIGYMQNVLQSAASGMGLGDMGLGNAALVIRALTGKLINTKDETNYYIYRDSAGNMQIHRKDSRSYDLAGYATVLTEQRQIGRIQARRDVATYGFGGFFSISGGSTTFKHQ